MKADSALAYLAAQCLARNDGAGMRASLLHREAKGLVQRMGAVQFAALAQALSRLLRLDAAQCLLDLLGKYLERLTQLRFDLAWALLRGHTHVE